MCSVLSCRFVYFVYLDWKQWQILVCSVGEIIFFFLMVAIILPDDVFRGNALWAAFHILLPCVDVLQRVKA